MSNPDAPHGAVEFLDPLSPVRERDSLPAAPAAQAGVRGLFRGAGQLVLDHAGESLQRLGAREAADR